MDELDRKLITKLQQDGRASNALLGRQVEVSEGTVRRRLKRLIQDGMIRVVAVPDPKRLGYATEALVGIYADPAKDRGRGQSVDPPGSDPLDNNHHGLL